MRIKVWVCPTAGCGNYYGSSSERDLSKEVTGHRGMNGERWPDRGHSRAQCPDCGAERVPVPIEVGAWS